MSNRPRRDGDRRPSDNRDNRGDRGERRESQPDEEQQRRPGDFDLQESDSLTALKAILGKVATLLNSLKLTQDECISLVEQLYGSVLDMDVKLAGETDDKRKSSVLAHIQNTNVTRNEGKLVVEFPKVETPKPAPAAAKPAPEATPVADRPSAPAQSAPQPTEAETEPVAEKQPAVEPAPAPEAAPEAAATPEPEAAPEPPAEAAIAAPEPQEKLDLDS